MFEAETMKGHEGRSSFHADGAIERLVSMFEACTLPRHSWDHRAHLAVGLWYLLRHKEAEATKLIRKGIQRYNRACGVETTETGGYHETITLFYVRMIAGHLRRCGRAGSIAELMEGLFDSIGDKQLPFEYYSKELLMSLEARRRWVEPDLKPLD